ncbi:MAG TPA: sugar-binding domain-containing protein [Negativicutes bacterium]|nr:sugar-binding domain-containing protein [Negativicutes bacterium]
MCMQDVNQYSDTLVKIAELHFIENYSQAKIAEMLSLSKPTVSRMVRRAVETGLVSIRINSTMHNFQKLAKDVENRYGLHKVFVVRSNDNDIESMKSDAARYAAEYVCSIANNNDLIGMSHGSTVFHILKHLQPVASISVNAIQLIGNGTSNYPYVQGSYVVQELARILGGTAYVMPLPMSVRSKLLHTLFMEEGFVQAHFKRFNNLKIAVVGIGTQVIQYETEEIRPLIAIPSDFAGEICCRLFSDEGEPLETGYQEHCFGISFDELRAVPEVIGLAVGSNKLRAVKGALKTGMIKTLITDERIASYLLQN